MNEKQRKAIASVVISVTGNIAVIGAGLALYEKKWESLFVACISLVFAVAVAWRSNK